MTERYIIAGFQIVTSTSTDKTPGSLGKTMVMILSN